MQFMKSKIICATVTQTLAENKGFDYTAAWKNAYSLFPRLAYFSEQTRAYTVTMENLGNCSS